MPRLQMYEQQTIAQSPTASGAAFGSQVGEATAQMGNAIHDIGVQMKRREDVIDRTIRARDFDTWARESLRGLEPADLARAETMQQYLQGLDQKFQETLNAHPGTSASRAEFKNQLLNQRYQYETAAREAQVRAQHQVLGNIITDTVNELGAQAAFVPDMMETIFDEMDARINQFADALPAPVIEEYRRSGRTEIAVTAIKSLMAEQNIDAADALMRNPEVSRHIPPNVSRQLVLGIRTEQVKRTAEEARRQSNLATWANVVGMPVDQFTPQQRMMIENADPKLMEQAQRFSMIEMLTGQRPTGDMTERLFGLDRTTRSNNMRDIAAMAPAYAAGQLDPEDAAVFEMQIARTFRPAFRQDPVTGTFVPIANSENIPPALARQIQQGRMFYGGGGQQMQQPSRIPGGPPTGAQMVPEVDNSFIDSQGRMDFRVSPPQPGEPGYESGPSFTPAEDRELDALIQEGGLWGLSDRIAGPVAGARRAIGGGPVNLGIGQEEVAAAARSELIQRRLVTALQQNPRYAEGERQDIARSISIEPSLMQNPTAYRTRLLEIGEYLRGEIAHNSNILRQDPSTTTVEMRQQALQAIPLMQKVLEALQLPPMVRTPEDALKMNPRPRQVIGPDGRTVYDVPQE